MAKLKQKQPTHSRLIFLVLILLGVAVVLCQKYVQSKRSPSVFQVSETPVAPSPTASPVVPATQVSPDGLHTVSLKRSGDAVQILVNDHLITTKRLGADESLVLPFNTWSPDNKYFFVQEKQPNNNQYLVMAATGKTLNGESIELNVAELFRTAYPELTLADITGWAAPTLLIINAAGPYEANVSFWFDVATHKFIRLSTYFN